MRDEALDRFAARVMAIPEDERSAYLFLCMSILASNAPEVALFVLDRADERLGDAA